ncbi:hypothetical protein Nepgr_008671 [Nepenthes gracilis]|uniref:adenylate kinase n=1 Tax=Nepenthes gracilis TaxID=150966 RepID=A0AAD3SA29_NEPGR|nr:hypothetical protein Nepgr_008671 [Nepenthes gracilis]
MARLSRLTAQIRMFASARRSYGASAAAQFEYDFDDDNDEFFDPRWVDLRRRIPKPMVGGERSEEDGGLQWVIMGEPGTKKHVYAEWLAKLLDVPHISMGSLVRQELNPGSSIHKQIENAMNQGMLVPEDIIFGLLSKRLEEGYCKGENGFILDGIPRTRIQAEILDQIADVDLVLNFKCSNNGSVKRHFGSVTQSNQIKPLRTDEEAIWEEKLRSYAEQSKPLEDYYRLQRKLLNFDVASAPGETWQGLLAALHLQHMNPSISTHKLTA